MAPEHSYSAQEPVELPPDTLVDRVISLGLWGAGLSWMTALMGAQIAMYTVRPPDRVRWLERVMTAGQVLLTGSRWRAEVHPDVDPDRPYAFFQNHVSHFDHCTLNCATPHYKTGLELDKHFDYPVYGWYMRSRGTIRVTPDDPRGLRTLVKRVREEYRRGHSFIVFPEGTRTRTGWLGEFQPGVFRIMMQLGIPIVPVTVTGTYRVMRKGSLLIRPGHELTCYCDAPIETAGRGRGELEDVMNEVRVAMHARLEDYWNGS